jgi:hypothetical protein
MSRNGNYSVVCFHGKYSVVCFHDNVVWCYHLGNKIGPMESIMLYVSMIMGFP